MNGHEGTKSKSMPHKGTHQVNITLFYLWGSKYDIQGILFSRTLVCCLFRFEGARYAIDFLSNLFLICQNIVMTYT